MMTDSTNTPPSLDRELKRGVLDLVLLVILGERPRYGYEIVTTITEETDGLLEVREGTLYPVLYRLEAAGFIEAYWEAPTVTRGRSVPRKYYRVTETGHAQRLALTQQWHTFANAIERVIAIHPPRN